MICKKKNIAGPGETGYQSRIKLWPMVEHAKKVFWHYHKLLQQLGTWSSVVVKALRYWSDGPGIDSRWCHLIFQ